MALFTSVQSGNYNDPNTWDQGAGAPGVADTFAVASGHTVTVSDSQESGGTVTGTLNIQFGGLLKQSSNITVNSGGTFGNAGTLDQAGFFLYSADSASCSLNLVGTPTNRAKVISTVLASGGIMRQSNSEGFQGANTVNYCDFIDAGNIRLGRNWSGGKLDVQNVLFLRCDEFRLGGYHDANSDFIIDKIDVRDSASATGNVGVLERQNGANGAAGTGTKLISNFTVDKGTGTATVLRNELDAVDMTGNIILKNVTLESVLNDGNLTQDGVLLFIEAGNALGVDNAGANIKSNWYIYSESNNPHILFDNSDNYLDLVIENTYIGEAVTDRGDAWSMSDYKNQTVTGCLVLERQGGVFANALGGTQPYTYNVNHNTIIANGTDPNYGHLFRTETGGEVTGTLNLQSNLVVNTSGDNTNRAINIDGATVDDIDVMDHNNYFGYGANTYYGVSSATKTVGDVGYGGNDTTHDPMFLDDTRDFAAYGSQIGTAQTAAAVIDHYLTINGFNAISETQVAAEQSGANVAGLLAWVREGYQTQQPLLNNAGHDGATVGAMGYVAAGFIVALNEAEVAPGETVTWTTDMTGVTGAYLTDSQGNQFSFTGVSDTGATLPPLSHGLAACLFGSNLTLTITNGTDTATDVIDFVPVSGDALLTVADLSGALTSADWGYHFTGLANSDQATFTPNSAVADLNADGTNTNNGPGTIAIYGIKASDGGVSLVNYTNEPADETPDAFTFTDLTGQTRSVQIESNAITVTGIDAVDIPVSVTGGSWSKSTDGGSTWTAWSVDPGTVTLNDLVKVRHTTSAAYDTAVNTTLDVNGVTDTFTTTTIAGDVTAPVLSAPSAFATGETTASGSVSTDEANGTLYYVASANATETVATVKAGASKGVTLTGTQNVSVTGLTENTAYYLHFVHTDAAGNDSGRVSSAQFTTDAAATAPVMAADTTVNVNEHTTLVGTFAAVSGTAPITYSISGVDAGSFTINGSTGQLNFGVAPNYEKDPTSYTVTVTATNAQGSASQTLTVAVQDVAEDTTPDAFSFIDQTDVAQSQLVESNAITVTGVKAGEPVAVSITGGQYAVSTDGGSSYGAWTSATTNVELGYLIKVQHTSAANPSTAVSTTLTVGGINDTFTSTTAADQVAPVITLTGLTAYTLLVGDAWSEPGYSAADNVDGNLSASVVIGGDTVNTAVAGTYTITYNVDDSEGNSAEQVTRTITVVEPGIVGITGTVSAGSTFTIDLLGLPDLAAGESWKGYIQNGADYYPLTISTVTITSVQATAANDTPIGAGTVILQQVKAL